MKELSIIVITWNSESYIENCLQSILQSTEGYDREIILIDNHSSDSTVRIVEQYATTGEISIIFNPKNEGVAKARNTGINRATGEYIWLLDSDTIVNKEAITALMDYMKNHSTCGICGCKLISTAGDVQYSCRRYPTLRYKWNNVLSSFYSRFRCANTLKKRIDSRNQSQFYEEQIYSYQPFEVDYIIGACQLIRSKVITQIGLLDEKIFYGPEDADFCLRANQKGWKVLYIPTVSIIHEYQQITHKKLFSNLTFQHTKALLYFFGKHRQYLK